MFLTGRSQKGAARASGLELVEGGLGLEVEVAETRVAAGRWRFEESEMIGVGLFGAILFVCRAIGLDWIGLVLGSSGERRDSESQRGEDGPGAPSNSPAKLRRSDLAIFKTNTRQKQRFFFPKNTIQHILQIHCLPSPSQSFGLPFSIHPVSLEILLSTSSSPLNLHQTPTRLTSPSGPRTAPG